MMVSFSSATCTPAGNLQTKLRLFTYNYVALLCINNQAHSACHNPSIASMHAQIYPRIAQPTCTCQYEISDQNIECTCDRVHVTWSTTLLSCSQKVFRQQQHTHSFLLPWRYHRTCVCTQDVPACALHLHKDDLASPWKVFLVIQLSARTFISDPTYPDRQKHRPTTVTLAHACAEGLIVI